MEIDMEHEILPLQDRVAIVVEAVVTQIGADIDQFHGVIIAP